MMGILIAVHIIACIGLIFFILIQSGRGGGLIESFTSAESIFGTKTNVLLAKVTTGLAITFFITCLTLAFLSVQQNKSIVQREVMKQSVGTTEMEEILGEVAEEASEELSETLEETINDTLPEQTETIDQTQENNAATEKAAAIQ